MKNRMIFKLYMRSCGECADEKQLAHTHIQNLHINIMILSDKNIIHQHDCSTKNIVFRAALIVKYFL